ncbi:hypothetical protein [Neomegalonema perideroedes]|uniref:hypothetical protein n=1 Tax=Neomegalonema perideroedes TaxID=217219 RepID=UPI00037B4C94|nr:hypothetical protein [Neomegalonema perideroedes]
MATYKQIQEAVKARFPEKAKPKTCWIADVKAQHGLTLRRAPNRSPDGARMHPCPPDRYADLVEVMRDLGLPIPKA